MKLWFASVVLALTFVLLAQSQVLADYLQTSQSATAPSGSTSVGSVSSSSALTSPSTVNAAPIVQIDNHDAGWNWSNMVEYSDPFLYQKSGYAGGPGSYGVYTFHGTGVEITGMGGPSVTLDGVVHTMGSIEVFIDGKQIANNDLKLKQAKYRDSIFKIDGLDPANHVLHIQPIGGWIVVNYITVLNSPPQPAVEQTAADDDKGASYRLIPRNAPAMCLDVVPGAVNGGALDIWTPDSSRLQTWHLKPNGDGTYTLRPVGYPDEAVWIIPCSPTYSPTQAGIWTYSAKPNQILTLTPTDSGYYEISGQDPNMVMDVEGIGTAAGTRVIGFVWKNGTNQQWYLQKVVN